MLAYLRGTFEISSGYSVAMSIPGQWYEIYLALLVLMAYLYLSRLLHLSRDKFFPVSLSFLPSLFVVFKHGFVRQGPGHVPLFFVMSLFIFGLLFLFSNSQRRVEKYLLLTLVLGICFFVNCKLGYYVLPQRLSPVTAIRMIFTGSGLPVVDKTKYLASEKLPKDILEEIGRGGVGVFPWEVTYIAANNLNYNPFPVFQTYVAYTSYLDNLNASHLSGSKAPPWLLMDFQAIDSRHCLIDGPATWLAIYKWYEPFRRLENLLVLKRKQMPLFDKLETVERVEHRITDTVRVPESDAPLVVRIPMDLTFWGKAVKTFYKIRPIQMVLTDDVGMTHTYRIVPDTLRNGMFINYLPLDVDDLEMLFSAGATREIVSLRLVGDYLKFYRKNVSVEFRKVPGIGISRIEPIFPDIPRSTGKTLSSIDYINGARLTSDPKIIHMSEHLLTVQGWAVDSRAERSSGGVWAQIGEKCFKSQNAFSRGDVAAFYKNNEFIMSGFSFAIPLSDVGPGVHTLSLRILAHDKQSYYQTGEITLQVMKD